MDYILMNNLPLELVEDIMLRVHKSYMKDLLREITDNVVWIRTPSGDYSFLIGKTSTNPYYVLRSYIPANFKKVNYFITNHFRYNYIKEN